jgi:hypothetical protein
MLVGLAVTLATASVIEQKAVIRIAQQQQAPVAAPETVAPATIKIKTSEPARSLVVASRHRHDDVVGE